MKKWKERKVKEILTQKVIEREEKINLKILVLIWLILYFTILITLYMNNIFYSIFNTNLWTPSLLFILFNIFWITILCEIVIPKSMIDKEDLIPVIFLLISMDLIVWIITGAFYSSIVYTHEQKITWLQVEETSLLNKINDTYSLWKRTSSKQKCYFLKLYNIKTNSYEKKPLDYCITDNNYTIKDIMKVKTLRNWKIMELKNNNKKKL